MSKTKSQNSDAKPDGLKENIRVFIFAGIIAILIRSLFFQPFNIPSSSMKPTLLIGDFLFVSKFSYGYSRHSFPFSLLPIDGRTSTTGPERGDVVVFKLPADNRTDFIKRVIGLPGDSIQMVRGQLFINGQGVKREPMEAFLDLQRNGEPTRIRRFRETLPSGRSYEILDQIDNGPVDTTPIYDVPEGHYFMMGDNRDNSTDSRFGRYVGYVPFENLVGPAQILFFSFDDRTRWYEIWRWPISIRGTRLLDWVR